MTNRTLLLALLALAILTAAVAGHLVWGDAPMTLADDIIVWGN